MATEVAPRPETVDAVATPRAVHRRRGVLLMAAAVFNVWVWATRVRNLLGTVDDFSAAFIGVHAVLYGSATVVAIVVGVIGYRQWREARPTSGRPA